MKKSELKSIIKEELLKLNEGRDPKPSPESRKKLKGMVKLPAKQFHQAVNYIYYSKETKDWWFISHDGDLGEIRNLYFLKEIDKYVKDNNIEL